MPDTKFYSQFWNICPNVIKIIFTVPLLVAPWFWLLSDILWKNRSFDPQNPLESRGTIILHTTQNNNIFCTKEVKSFPKCVKWGGKIGNAQKTKDMFFSSGMASLMNAGLLHGSVGVINVYNFLLA